MLRRFAFLAWLALLPACEKKPKYDDGPIARDDRKKKSAEPKETFDVEAICTQLVDLPGPSIEAALKPDLREMCRKGLTALEKDRPEEYACRCTCIRSAGDLMAVERCERFCIADDPERVCDHVVGVEQETNDAGGLDAAHQDCIAALNRLHTTDLARWSCTVRCLVAATAKEDALACSTKCAASGTKPVAPKGDAGADAAAKDPLGDDY